MYEDVRNDLVSVGATSVRVSFERLRKVIYIKNTSTGGQVITIRLDSGAAVAGYGVVLGVNETLIDSNTEGYMCYQGEINAIASAAGGQVSVMER